MGIEPFLIASATNLILAQRLARKICKDCKEEVHVPPQGLIDIGVPADDAKSFKCYHGKGCSTCNGSGYKGRIALYEVMPLTESLKELVLNGASSAELKRGAVKEGMKTLRMSGITKIKEGVTTIEEVVRTTMAD